MQIPALSCDNVQLTSLVPEHSGMVEVILSKFLHSNKNIGQNDASVSRRNMADYMHKSSLITSVGLGISHQGIIARLTELVTDSI